MARQGKGILDGISGSIGSLTGFRRNKKSIIMKKVDRSKVNYSLSQLSVQAKMSQVLYFLQDWYEPVVKQFVYYIDPKLNPWSWFIHNNFKYFNTAGVGNPNALKISTGTLDAAVITGRGWINTGHYFTIRWTEIDPIINSDPYDVVYLMAYHQQLKEFIFGLSPYRRFAHFGRLTAPASWGIYGTATLYLIFRDVNGWINASSNVQTSVNTKP